MLFLRIERFIFITFHIFYITTTRGASPTRFRNPSFPRRRLEWVIFFSRKQEFFLINREPIDRTVHSRKPRIVYPTIGRHD